MKFWKCKCHHCIPYEKWIENGACYRPIGKFDQHASTIVSDDVIDRL